MLTKALVVLSGGQDSTTCLFWAKQQYDEIFAVTFDYNQKHRREIDAARTIARMAGVVKHETIVVGPVLAGKSPLTNIEESLETYKDFASMEAIIGDRRELTFVPMRNPLFLVLAANRAEVWDCKFIVTGVCEADNANYSDCTQAFVTSMEVMTNTALGYADRLKIVTPLITLPKAESVKLALTLPGCMEALAYSHTAYSGEYPPLTQDHATVLRAKGFEDAGVPDPLIARAAQEGLMPLPASANYDSLRV